MPSLSVQDSGGITPRITGHERKDYEFKKDVDECSRACGCYAASVPVYAFAVSIRREPDSAIVDAVAKTLSSGAVPMWKAVLQFRGTESV